ncbi:hypothetical protein [Streptobacillus canis]|uniref:hypothetical protein n=1 Tax=Streptobacillus canis TaxID=2678686 RepID=UPI0012E0E41C|nr:hypothetical protein [Streptobacillus canis]
MNSMFLAIVPTKNNIHVYAKRKYRDPKTRKLVTKTYSKLGSVSGQDKLNEEQIKYFNALIDELNKKEEIEKNLIGKK